MLLPVFPTATDISNQNTWKNSTVVVLTLRKRNFKGRRVKSR